MAGQKHKAELVENCLGANQKAMFLPLRLARPVSISNTQQLNAHDEEKGAMMSFRRLERTTDAHF